MVLFLASTFFLAGRILSGFFAFGRFRTLLKLLLWWRWKVSHLGMVVGIVGVVRVMVSSAGMPWWCHMLLLLGSRRRSGVLRRMRMGIVHVRAALTP